MTRGNEVFRDRRLVLVVAAAGYGKSTAVRTWLADALVVWSSGRLPDPGSGLPPDLAAAADGSAGADSACWLVVDDLDTSGEPAFGALTEWVAALPGPWRVALIFRWPPAGPIRHGPASSATPAVVGPADLALPAGRVADLLGRRLTPDLVSRIHEFTAGWPALVTLAGEQAMAAPPANDEPVEVLAGPGTALARYVEQEILEPLPAAARRVFRDAAHLGQVCSDLLGPQAHQALDHLARCGLLVPCGLPAGTYEAGPEALAGGWYRPVPAVAAVARQAGPAPDARCRRRWRAAAGWCRQRRLPGHAARLALVAGDPATSAEVLREQGERIVAAGGAELVVATVRAMPAPSRDNRLQMVLGEALAVLGDNDAALAELSALAGGTGPVEPAVAWRLGAVHYQRAERDAALAALARGRLGNGSTLDEALLLAQAASVHWSDGDGAQCRAHAERAMTVATAAGDHRALAAARVAMALHAALTGDRNANAAHYEAALRHAEAGGDAVQVARIRANQASMLLEEARFPEALAAADAAVTAAGASGQAAVLAVALVNAGEALVRLCRLVEAEQRYQRAITINQRAGSGTVAYPLTGLGDLHAARGAWGLARAAYEEALRAAERAGGSQQCRVPALAGLARVVAAEDPPAGRRLADAAVVQAAGPLRTRALLAAGWVAVAEQDRPAALASAGAAASSARRHRDRAGLAEALELAARAQPADPTLADAGSPLREAARTWHGTGSRLDADRVAVLLGRLSAATAWERIDGRLARSRLEEAGVFVPADPSTPDVLIRTLGRFEVVVAGQVVPTSGWHSRKARDLLRILVARQGRMVPREELGALLWPDDNAARVSHRLSVALSTLRSVLDPSRRVAADYFVVATSGGVRLDLENLTIDLQMFLAEAALGLRLHHDGEPATAYPALAAAERSYTGDFCEDEPYQDWSAPVREEARAAYLRVLRALAEVTRRLGQVDEAAGHLLRLLRQDRYDEPAHRALITLLTTAGRHGEAGRARARYQEAMGELDLPARRHPGAGVGGGRGRAGGQLEQAVSGSW